MPALLLVVPHRSRLFPAECHSADLLCQIIDILATLIWRRRLWWEVALLLGRRSILGWHATILIGRLAVRGTARLLISRWTGSNRRTEFVCFFFARRAVWIR